MPTRVRPSEVVAEAYIMRTLSKDQATEFDYVACNHCATVPQRTAEYVEAMRAVAKKGRSEPKS